MSITGILTMNFLIAHILPFCVILGHLKCKYKQSLQLQSLTFEVDVYTKDMIYIPAIIAATEFICIIALLSIKTP